MSATSPRLSRYAREAELEMERAKPRVGLSQYTSNRLAELRARRAAQEDDLRSSSSVGSGISSSLTGSSGITSTTGELSGRSSETLQSLAHRTPADKSGKPDTTISSLTLISPKKPSGDSLTASVKSASTRDIGNSSVITRDQRQTDLEVSQRSSTEEKDLHQGSQRTGLSPRDFVALKPDIKGSENSLLKSSSWRVAAPKGDTEKGSLTSDPSDIMSRSKEYPATYSHTVDALGHLGRSNSKSLSDMEDDDSVGFSSLPEQVHRKALKRGFDFTLMVVGESGLGKSTLIQSLFLNTELYNNRKIGAVHERIMKTVEIEKKYMEIEERGVKLRLTIVDTPGFNDSLCGEDSWKPVETYIDQQFEQYFKDESGLNRKNIKDNRVHCCLYFVSPFGHGLRPLDIYFMKRLHHKVNIVPIIAKADTLTHAEVRKMKASIMEQIENNDIHIYEFPDCDSDEDEEFKKQDLELKASIPFAVIGSNTIVEVGGKKIRGRLYPWGIVEVDNPDHCDFTKLRQMLISTHMQDLKDVTRDSHYENYRANHISEQINKQTQRDRNKLKRDSSPNFETIVATEQLLEQKDQEIRQMQEMLVKMQTQLKASQSPVSKPRMSGLGNL